MATLATVSAALVTKLNSLALLTSRMAVSQYRDDLDAVPRGETRYQIRGQYESDDGRNSAAPKKAVSLIVEFHHHIDLVAGSTELTHVDGDMVTIQAATTGVAWWKSLSGVFELRSGPDMSIDLRRSGNILSYGVGVELVLAS